MDYMINNDDFNILIETQQKKMKEDVAQQYISARKALKLTQEDIAKRPNITRFERGDYNPTIDMLVKVAASMGKKLEINLVDKE